MASDRRIKLVDVPAGGPDIEFLFETSTTQKFTIGQRMCLTNGAVFHYAYALTALVRNTIAGAATPLSGNNAGLVLGSGSTAGAGGLAGAKTARVVCSATAATKDQFAGGQYVVSSHAVSLNSLQSVFIKSHNAAATGTEIVMELENPLLYNLDSASQGNLIPNPFYGVAAYAATSTAYPVGLAVTTVAATSYCWLQTWGPNAAVCSGAPPKAGGGVSVGSTAGGVVTSTANPALYPMIGFGGVKTGGASGLVSMFLTIMP